MQDSPISWTQKTSNPIRAVNLETGKEGWFCTKITDGCSGCYASDWNTFRGNGLEFNLANLPKIRWVLKEKEFAQWFAEKEPKKIFVCDMTDLFHDSIPNSFRDAIFEAMEKASWHTYQILTKRTENMKKYLLHRYILECPEIPSFLWLGTSVENQKVKYRIDILRSIPTKVHFLSCEPLLESLGELNLENIQWVIAGAESGVKRRAYSESWAKEIREQCLKQNTAFWYKQGSDRFSGQHVELDGTKYHTFPTVTVKT